MSILTDIKSTSRISFDEALAHAPYDGMILEFGVAQGGSIRKIAHHFPSRHIYGFDSFEGLPERWREGYQEGHFKCDAPTDLPSNVTLIKGLFQDTFETFLQEHTDPIACIHMDADLYSSCAYVLNAAKNQFRNGAVILFDEIHGYDGYEDGEYKAFQEFLNLGLYTYDCIGEIGDEQAAFKLSHKC